MRWVAVARLLHDNARRVQNPNVSRQLCCQLHPPAPHNFEIHSSFSSSDSSSAADEAASLKALADEKRRYEKKTSDLRKKYAADILEKRLLRKKIEEQQRKEVGERKAIRIVEKKERAAARAIEVAEEHKAFQAILQEQRTESARQRARVEGSQGYIRFKRMEAVRRQSSMWIEEKDLERRIFEALANPYQLAGSSAMEVIDKDESYYDADDS